MLGKRPSNRRWLTLEERVEQALRPGAHVDAPALILLIHEVNPSGRELPAEIERRRYGLKSRLQSLLISKFKGQLDMVPVSGSSDVVSLRYRPQNRDACHAVVQDLEEEARAYVRLTLDLLPAARTPEQGTPQTGSPHSSSDTRSTSSRQGAAQTQATPSTPRDLLKAGYASLAAYDFESARGYFARALRSCAAGPESVEAARACLDLLVDRLAAYEEGAQLEADLPADTLVDPLVRSTLALAQAHLGRSAEVRRLLDGISGDRPAEALIALARGALAKGAAKDAERWIEDARKAAPSHADVVTTSEELRRLVTATCRPLEEELEHQYQSGDEAGSEQKARHLLQTFGESAAARRVLREIEGRRKERAAKACRAKAEEALAQGEYAKASALFRDAEAFGSTGLGDRIAAADELEGKRRERVRTEDTLRVLGKGLNEDALVVYSSEPERVRAAVREGTGMGELSWLEELQPKDERQSRAAAAAILAFRRALSATTEGEPQALERLLIHEPILHRLRSARQWMARVRLAQEERRSAKARELLSAAEALLASSNPSEVLQLLATPNLRELPERFRVEAAQLSERAREAQEEGRRGEHFERLVASGELLEALALCREHSASGQKNQRPWLERMGRVQGFLRKKFRIHTTEGSFAMDCGFWSDFYLHEGAYCGLSADAGRFYLITVVGQQVFIRAVEVTTGQVRALVSLEAPEELEPFQAHVDPRLLRMVGGNDAILELSVSSWDVERWIPGAKRIPEGRTEEDALLVPLTGFLWMCTGTATDDWRLQVRDVTRERAVREVVTSSSYLQMSLVPAPEAVRVFASDTLDANLYEPSGAQMSKLPDCARCTAVAPEGAGWIASSENMDREPSDIILALVGPDGSQKSTIVVDDSRAEWTHHLATSLSEKRTFLTYSDGQNQSWLAAFELSNGALRQSYRLPIPKDYLLIQDLSSRSVVMAAQGKRSSAVRVLGARAPSLEAESGWKRRELPRTMDVLFCGRSHTSGDQFKDPINEARRGSDEEREMIVETFLHNHRDDEPALIRFSEALDDASLGKEAEKVKTEAWARFPDGPLSRLTRAHARSQHNDWAAVLPLLEGMSSDSLERERRMHFHHLRGVAYLKSKDVGRAVAEFEDAARNLIERGCHLLGWLELGWALARDGAKGGRPHESASWELVKRIRFADECLAKADATGVLDVLDVPWIWEARHTQAFARLAWAVLHQEPARDWRLFHARLILSRYLEARKYPQGEPPLAYLEWEEPKLEDLATKAISWLQQL